MFKGFAIRAIDPVTEHRPLMRQTHVDAGFDFFGVLCDTRLEDCARPHPNGRCVKARTGITCFAGIDSRYRRPGKPDLRLTPNQTGERSAQQPVGPIESRR